MDLPLWFLQTMTVPEASQVAILSKCLFQRTMVTYNAIGEGQADKLETWGCYGEHARHVNRWGEGGDRWVRASVLASVSTN